jgi:amino-acid N-acetyltransferase
MNDIITYRRARAADISGIANLINGYAEDRVMLPRTPESIGLTLDDFIVAVDGHGRVSGCGALKEYSPSLAEVASLAVARDAHGRGVGRELVARLEELAARRGVREVFALTLTPAFFERAGYAVVDRAMYPEKIRRDCLSCARRFACAEICVRHELVAEELAVAA